MVRIHSLALIVLTSATALACGASAAPRPADVPGDALHDPAANATKPPAPSAPSAATARFPVMPMKLVFTNVARHESHALELKGDATLWGDGAQVGTLQGAQIVTTDGKVVLSVGEDGKVMARGQATPMRFDGEEIVFESGAKMSIDEKGQLLFVAPGKEPTHMPIVVEPYAAKGERTALLLTVLVALPTD